MSQDLPIPRQQEIAIPRQEDRADGAAVLEWGPAAERPAGRIGRTLSDLGRDRRLPPVLAGLGAVAAVASLVGEWLVMTVPNSGPEGNTALRIPGNVSEVGGFGVGYLVGLLALSGVVALALGGTPTVRRNARTAGLALAAALLALLVATGFALDDPGQRTLFYSPEDGFEVEYGRGLVMAFVGCLFLAAALQLSGSGRRPAATGGRADDAGDDPTTDGHDGSADRPEHGDDPPAGFAGWRRGRRNRRAADEDDLPAPADLTVQPTVPFARPEPPA
ncbi:hypothetical protein [Micromonospora fluostatini]|uniref:hypothetical protein n=1 Tax=Micromonospora sp. JCM 30529 TaxID=3421643 RepID=UPI003D17E30A